MGSSFSRHKKSKVINSISWPIGRPADEPLPQYQCPCCMNSFDKYGMNLLPCEHMVCKQCLENIAKYKAGDTVVEWKHLCPICRYNINPAIDQFTSQIKNTIMNPESVYKFCAIVSCTILFEAGSKECATDPASLPIHCPKHQIKNQFECPNCKQQIEYMGGCDNFTCCIYGTDKCKKEKCDHGGLCGFKWKIDRSKAVYYDKNNQIASYYQAEDRQPTRNMIYPELYYQPCSGVTERVMSTNDCVRPLNNSCNPSDDFVRTPHDQCNPCNVQCSPCGESPPRTQYSCDRQISYADRNRFLSKSNCTCSCCRSTMTNPKVSSYYQNRNRSSCYYDSSDSDSNSSCSS